MQTHLWWQTSVTPAQSGWGSPGTPGAPSSGGRQGMQTACVRRQWHHVWSSAGQRWTTAWEPEQRARYRIKVLARGVRHVRPLAAVADVGDVALPRGGDGQVDLGAPRHVGTHAEEVLELGGRQGRVFVLRQRRSLCQNNNHHRPHPCWQKLAFINKQPGRWAGLTSSYLSKSCCRNCWPRGLSSVVQPLGTLSLTGEKKKITIHLWT